MSGSVQGTNRPRLTTAFPTGYTCRLTTALPTPLRAWTKLWTTLEKAVDNLWCVAAGRRPAGKCGIRRSPSATPCYDDLYIYFLFFLFYFDHGSAQEQSIQRQLGTDLRGIFRGMDAIFGGASQRGRIGEKCRNLHLSSRISHFRRCVGLSRIKKGVPGGYTFRLTAVGKSPLRQRFFKLAEVKTGYTL